MTGIKVCIITIFFTAIYVAGTILLSNLFFYEKSNGSLCKVNNKIIGSRLIGQEFKSNLYFQGRPSLYNYKNNISGNSNLPYYSNELKNTVNKNRFDFLNQNNQTKPDLNLITQSASGLDPQITYEGALSQVNRIANTSGISKEILTSLIKQNSKSLAFELFGQKIVNVLELNLELTKILRSSKNTLKQKGSA